MKKLSKVIIGILGMVLVAFIGTKANAEELMNDTEYRMILESINKEYGTEIGYYPVDIEKISLTEYEEIARELAISQSELEKMIATRQIYDYKDDRTSNIAALTSTTKTVNQDVWHYENTAYITATYTVNGNVISSPSGISVHIKPAAAILGVSYTPNIGYPTTAITDGGRTLTVTYYGTYVSGATFTNIKFYTEFYYNS